MQERFRDKHHIVEKPKFPPISAYNNRVESRTLEELAKIEKDFGALHMESLAIRERVLGSDNPEVPHPVIFRGAVFADSSRFDRCIALWMHAMKLRQKNNRTISKDLLRFSQVFSQIVHIGVKLAFCDIEEVFEHAVIEVARDIERVKTDEDDRDALQEIYQSNIHTCLYLLVIALKVCKTPVEEENLYKVVYKFLKHKPTLKNGYTPLHMAVDSATLVDDFHVNDVVTFPNSGLAAMLIKCGSDVNALDFIGNSPLHVIVRYTNPISDFDTLHQIMLSLIRGGAHIDIRNYERKTPMECTTTGVAEVIIRQHYKISLKCLAARSITDNNVNFQNMIPAILEDFIHLH
ncbi:hypothetical protein LOTGIDRAFT_164973 [Lottia gigantea]|uniref:Uncharacterized protein n=1 Tax=Lottia gigantea TaxID=225164 RepID=V3ZEU1_LOTGI|nr:hypothetical protein LOTGIDRAFT_164973 [Lottia gigantea]ESO89668.1 hypothetical protein LOTGIDRAFT_164973 [Lottia gigantea]